MKENNLVIPDNTNIIINDTKIPTSQVEKEFSGLKTSKVQYLVLDANELTAPLESSFIYYLSQLDKSQTAILFPGNGSMSVKNRLSTNTLNLIRNSGYSANTKTMREYIYRGRAAVPVLTEAGIPNSLISKTLESKINTIVIVDDVVATGQTIQGMKTATEYMIRERLPIDNSYEQSIRFSFPNKIRIPQVKYSVFSWLLQKSADTTGFETFPASTYERRTGRVPVNSLSTMLYDTKKGQTVVSLYSNKYFDGSQEFLSLTNRLRNE